MSNKEEVANPYNTKKDWHKGKEKVFVSSNNVFYDEGSEEIPETDKDEDNNQEVEKAKPYQKTDYKKRYDQLKKHHDSKTNEFKVREKELIDEATNSRLNYQAPKTLEEVEKFSKQYPDVYKVVKTVASIESNERTKSLEEQLATIQEREKDLLSKQAKKQLLQEHPDFEEIKNSDGFGSWAQAQPKSIKDWVYNNENDADLASRALDLYKKDMNISNSPKPSSSKRTRKSAADMVTTKTTSVEPSQSKIWTEREIASMSINEYDKWEDAINQAVTEGRVAKS